MPELILVHIEIELDEGDFPNRMFQYYALFRFKYGVPVFPVAVPQNMSTTQAKIEVPRVTIEVTSHIRGSLSLRSNRPSKRWRKWKGGFLGLREKGRGFHLWCSALVFKTNRHFENESGRSRGGVL